MGRTKPTVPRSPAVSPPRTGKLWLRELPSWPSELQTPTPGSAQRRTNKYPVIDCNFSPSNKPFHKQKLTLRVIFRKKKKKKLPPRFFLKKKKKKKKKKS